MASPSVTQSGAWTGFSTGTPTFTSPAITSASDCLWIAISVDKGAGVTVQTNSITSAGVTWTNVGRSTFNVTGSIPYTVELWKAPLGSRTTYGATTVTVNLNTPCDGIAGVFWAVTGDFTPGSCTIDPNPSLPAVGGSASTPPPLPFSTSNPDDLLLWVGGSDTGSMQVNPNGWTNIQATGINITQQVHVAAAYLQVSAKQNNVSLTWTGITEMVSALTAESADAAATTKGFIIGMPGMSAA